MSGVACFIGCVSTIFIGLGVAEVVLAYSEPADCFKDDPTGIDVEQWLLGSGWSHICSMLVLCITAPYIMDGHGIGMIGGCLGGMAATFNTAWDVVGIVMLARSSGECLKHNTNTQFMLSMISIDLLILGGATTLLG